ncbi:helix-turn-helix domain-containing protein [Sinorhizobium meliloti]|nr:helix-turn-helix domain-containing protein [Sinorhizobium meliloti]MDW9809131.1 helix-turn-helix domain-containing protein [Sinorhizobium meliloti]MDX0124428.1 helix-turn-helix domain-containing protein [Sinorhizobium meliloti]
MKIRDLREANEYSQQQLAELLEVSQQAVAKWETGRAEPSLEVLNRLADVFGVSVDEVLGRTGRNPPWTRDELILALDLYMTNPASPPSKRGAEVEGLSDTLNQLARWMGVDAGNSFRNSNGVYMKMMNFRRFDSTFASQGKVGLSRGGQLEEVVWAEFARDVQHLRDVAEAITAAVRLPLEEPFTTNDDIEVVEAEEGRVLTRLHRTRERSRKLVEERKRMAVQQGHGIRCEVCEFDFGATYGERGLDYIEVHHTRPLHTLPETNTTKLEDLALLCANCHRMVHARTPWLTMDELHRLHTKNKG